MVLTAPMDEQELNQALIFALKQNYPCALRYPRDLVPPPLESMEQTESPPFELGKARILRTGKDVVILAYGVVAHHALQAAEVLANEQIEATIINGRFAKPIDQQLLNDLWTQNSKSPIITLEDHGLAGGFGSAVLEKAQQLGLDTRKISRLGLPDRFIHHNSRQEQLSETALNAEGIAEKVRNLLNLSR